MPAAKELIILGAGGHAKVVIDTARKCGFSPVAVFDDDVTLLGKDILGVKVVGRIKDLSDDTKGFAFIAIGSNRVREKLYARFTFVEWARLVHPFSSVSTGVEMGEGSLVCAGVIIQSDAKIGNQVIVNTGATVDHDCCIGDYVHICPGCNLAGSVNVGKGSFLGAGTTVIPGIVIGDWATIGAGSVIVKPIPDNKKAFGVPARFRD